MAYKFFKLSQEFKKQTIFYDNGLLSYCGQSTDIIYLL